MKAQQKETPGKRKLCLASLAAGAIGASLAAWALKIDATNNFHLGAQFSPEAAQGMIMAAIGVGVIPVLAVLNGWDRWLRITWTFAVALTIIAAVASYIDRQGNDISAKQGAHDRYQQAQADAAAARKDLAEAKAEAAAISEGAAVADLMEIVKRERELAQVESKDRGGRGKLAKAHEDAEKAALDRVPAARAKEAATDRAKQAQARLDAAQGETKAGPVNQNPLALAIAEATGQKPEDAARLMASLISVILISMTVTMGMLVDASAKLIRKGLGFGQPGQPKPEESPAPPQTDEHRAARKLAMLASMSDDERLDHFVATVARPFVAAKPITAKELYRILAEWWIERLPGVATPSQRKLAERMKAAELRSVKISGTMVYGADAVAA
jgi:hypothetical protein